MTGHIARFGSGGPWEAVYGYSRVVLAGGRAVTAGCTSTVDGVVTHVGDAAGQARQALRIGLDALAGAGVPASRIVRTRMYVVHAKDADAVGRVHGELLGDVRPAATLVLVAGLVHPDHLVEIELEALVD
jgi:enamine deaminase RidA (YjgF/YER057c/UK114 family)